MGGNGKAEERPVLDVAQVAELERRIAEAGTPLSELMERAGAAVADAVREQLGLREARRSEERAAQLEHARALAHDASVAFVEPDFEEEEAPRVVVLCGSGNNGGDGWVAARLLAQEGCGVTVVTPRPAADIKAQPAHDAAVEAQRVLESCGARILVRPDILELTIYLSLADVAVDAILGTGFSGEAVREPYGGWIVAANAMRAGGLSIVAADVPSGLSAQTGAAADPCIEADLTVTMIVQKPGLVLPQAARYCGEVRVAPLAPVDGLLEGLAGA